MSATILRQSTPTCNLQIVLGDVVCATAREVWHDRRVQVQFKNSTLDFGVDELVRLLKVGHEALIELGDDIVER